VQNREKCHLHALSVLARTIKKMTVFYLEMINDDFGSPASCMRGNLPLAPLCPLPARLPYQHSFARTEGGVGSRGRYHTVCRSSGEYTDGNPRRQAKDPFVEQINNDASRNSGLNLSLRYATVVPYSVLH